MLDVKRKIAYERKKFSRNIGVEKQAVTFAMTRVTCDQNKVDKMDEKITQRADKLTRQAEVVGLDRAKVQTAKKVMVCVFYSLHYCFRVYNYRQRKPLRQRKRLMPSKSERKRFLNSRALH